MKSARPLVPVIAVAFVAVGPPPVAAQKAKPPFPRDQATLAVRGRVVYDAEKPPRRRRLRMEGDAYCGSAHKDKVYLETLIVSKDLRIKNVFVYVKSGAGRWRYEKPSSPVFLDQIGCLFVPHVLGIRVGQKLVVRNSDNTNHNVHFLGLRNREWNKTQSKGQVLEWRFRRREIMGRIKCDIHSWMGAYVGILPHPFFAVTGDDGTFRLGKLPPGPYTIAAWHEKLGTLTRRIVLKAGDRPKPLVFRFPKLARNKKKG